MSPQPQRRCGEILPCPRLHPWENTPGIAPEGPREEQVLGLPSQVTQGWQEWQELKAQQRLGPGGRRVYLPPFGLWLLEELP